jgi:2-hydroxy-3-keto-5-methylthiopentenyl-1-phosphate phosphatase
VTGSRPTRLVLDWDGTITETDTLELVVRAFGDLDLWRRTGREMGCSLTHDEAVAIGIASVRAPLATVVDWLCATVRLRAGFHELVAEHAPLVISSGFRELIEPILRREGVRVDLVANRVAAESGGWRARFREQPPCAWCGERCKRAALPPGPVVYVGDGYSDRCAALAADRVFATGMLARELAARGVAHERFDDLRQVSGALRSSHVRVCP